MHFWEYLNNEGIGPYAVVEQASVVGILQIINTNSKRGDTFLDQNDHCLKCDYKRLSKHLSVLINMKQNLSQSKPTSTIS